MAIIFLILAILNYPHFRFPRIVHTFFSVYYNVLHQHHINLIEKKRCCSEGKNCIGVMDVLISSNSEN